MDQCSKSIVEFVTEYGFRIKATKLGGTIVPLQILKMSFDTVYAILESFVKWKQRICWRSGGLKSEGGVSKFYSVALKHLDFSDMYTFI